MKRVVIVGAGPQGLAAGIELLERGCDVTILEVRPQLGQGISHRPEFNSYGVLHSGAYYAAGSKRRDLSRKLYELLDTPSARRTVVDVYLRHVRKTGKLIVARGDAGMKNIEIFRARLKGSVVSYSLLRRPSEIAALDEPTLGDPSRIRAVMSFPKLGIIHIRNYVEDLRQAFERLGGALKTDHEVIAFLPRFRTSGCYTDVVSTTAGSQATFPAEVVINMAGLSVASVAEIAARALRNAGSKLEPPPTPQVRYDRFFVLVEKDRETPRVGRPMTRRVVYVADSAVLTGPNSTFGIHSFCDEELEPGLYRFCLGNFIQREIPADDIWDMNPAPPEVTEEMFERAEAVCPDLRREDYELRLLGRIGIPLTEDGQRDFFFTRCTDRDVGLDVLNCFTSDLPGLTCSPVIAREVAEIALATP